MMRDFDFSSVDVVDQLLHGPRPDPKLSFRVDPYLGVAAFVEMASTELKANLKLEAMKGKMAKFDQSNRFKPKKFISLGVGGKKTGFRTKNSV